MQARQSFLHACLAARVKTPANKSLATKFITLGSETEMRLVPMGLLVLAEPDFTHKGTDWQC